MIGRRDSNTSTSISNLAVAFIAILAFGASTDDVVEAARLRGGSGSVRKPTMPKAVSSSTSSLREVQRRTEEDRRKEEEENELLNKLEKEYHLEEQSRKEAMEDAMAMHNQILSDEDALAEMHELVSSLHEEEQQHQLRAKEETSTEEKPQSSLVDPELEESIQKQKEEFENYQDKLLEVKKRDEQLLRDVEEAMNQEQELKDKTDQEMYEHMHGNDESSAMIDEQSIQNSHEEEMKLQEEYHREKMEKEQKLQEEYLHQIEQEQQTLDLLRN